MVKTKSIIIFFFFFSHYAFAEDISDFQIDGMSIGDSLLDYFTKNEIINNKETGWHRDKDGKFMYSSFESSTYDGISIGYKNNDSEFIIEGIDGHILYKSNIEECYSKKEEIFNSISEMFVNLQINNKQKNDNKGKWNAIFLKFKSGDTISITCRDWSKRIEKENNWIDHLRVMLTTEELDSWIWTKF